MSRLLTGTSLPSKLLSLDLLNRSGSKAERYERILAHRIDCQRAISPPVQQKGNTTTKGVYVEALRMSTAETDISTAVGIRRSSFGLRCERVVRWMPTQRFSGWAKRSILVTEHAAPL